MLLAVPVVFCLPPGVPLVVLFAPEDVPLLDAATARDSSVMGPYDPPITDPAMDVFIPERELATENKEPLRIEEMEEKKPARVCGGETDVRDETGSGKAVSDGTVLPETEPADDPEVEPTDTPRASSRISTCSSSS